MNEQLKTLGFVDANILADAILVENRRDEIIREAQAQDNNDLIADRLNELFISYAPARHAYGILQAVRPPVSQFQIVTSNLALLEARSVIVEEYVARQLLRKGIPCRAWPSAGAKAHLSKNEFLDLHLGITRFITAFQDTLRIHDDYNLKLASQLVDVFRCDARDAILVATAVHSHCNVFISRDLRLKRVLRRFKEVRVIDGRAILNEIGLVVGMGKTTWGTSKGKFPYPSTDW